MRPRPVATQRVGVWSAMEKALEAAAQLADQKPARRGRWDTDRRRCSVLVTGSFLTVNGVYAPIVSGPFIDRVFPPELLIFVCGPLAVPNTHATEQRLAWFDANAYQFAPREPQKGDVVALVFPREPFFRVQSCSSDFEHDSVPAFWASCHSFTTCQAAPK